LLFGEAGEAGGEDYAMFYAHQGAALLITQLIELAKAEVMLRVRVEVVVSFQR
jgi:hypothetical protein